MCCSGRALPGRNSTRSMKPPPLFPSSFLHCLKFSASFRRLFCLSLILTLAAVLGACGNDAGRPASSPTQTAAALTPTLTPAATAAPGEAQKLILWLPPEFDPAADTPSGQMIKERLDHYSASHPELQIKVRLKAVDGPGGMLDALAAARIEAPALVPDLLLLPRTEMETAAIKGLVSPLETVPSAALPNEASACSFARELAQVQGSPYGVPFAGDALIMINRPGDQPPALTWNTLFAQPGLVTFPASDPQALTLLSLYLSTGATIEDFQQHLTLDPVSFETTLALLDEGIHAGRIPRWVAQYDAFSSIWQSYRDLRANHAVVWSHIPLRESGVEAILSPILPIDNHNAIILADGWVWALTGTTLSSQTTALELAQSFTDDAAQSGLIASTGYLPLYPSALEAGAAPEHLALLKQICLTAHLRPANDVLTGLGPVMRDAALQVLRGQVEPAAAARAAAQQLKGP